jgi:hypothetical protein
MPIRRGGKSVGPRVATRLTQSPGRVDGRRPGGRSRAGCLNHLVGPAPPPAHPDRYVCRSPGRCRHRCCTLVAAVEPSFLPAAVGVPTPPLGDRVLIGRDHRWSGRQLCAVFHARVHLHRAYPAARYIGRVRIAGGTDLGLLPGRPVRQRGCSTADRLGHLACRRGGTGRTHGERQDAHQQVDRRGPYRCPHRLGQPAGDVRSDRSVHRQMW